MERDSLTFEKKLCLLKNKFENLTPTQTYELIISMGRSLPPLESLNKTPENLVRGCQSELYVHAELRDNKLFFTAGSEALISAGLAALLISIYNGESVETVLSSPPHFLETLGIHASLSPNRSQGASHIYLKMKLQAILIAKNQLLGKS